MIIRLILLAIVLKVPESYGKTNPAMEKLKHLCTGSDDFFLVGYKQYCAGNTIQPQTAKVESTNAALCAVIAARFIDAEDIPVEDQETMMRTSNFHEQEENICSFSPDHIESIIDHLTKAVKYFETLRRQKYNTAIIATRSIQAQIDLALSALRKPNGEINLDKNLISKLTALKEYSKNISIIIEDSNAEYWSDADKITSTVIFWKSPPQNRWKSWKILESKKIDAVSQLKNLTHYHRDHELNNDCYSRMIRDCDLSQSCAERVMEPSAEITTLDHIVAFFRMAIQMECTDEIEFQNKFPDSNWEILVENNCAKMWDEANAIANTGFPVGYKALFLIHASMCASVGYPNFLRADWSNDILSWMGSTSTGCIPVESLSGDIDADYDDIAPNGDRCMIYETTVGMQVLALRLRYLIEHCPIA